MEKVRWTEVFALLGMLAGAPLVEKVTLWVVASKTKVTLVPTATVRELGTNARPVVASMVFGAVVLPVLPVGLVGVLLLL